jgi:competence protein ComEA
MNLKGLLSFVFVLMLAATLGYAQTDAQSSSDQTTTTTTKKTKKQKVKDAGSDVKQGTEDAASTTASGAKKVGTATANGTETAAKKTAKTTKNAANAATGKGKLDINAATKDQLDALPGIGESYSQKIIDGRPYNAKNDLVRRNIVPQSTYDGIKDQIIAHRAAGTAKK